MKNTIKLIAASAHAAGAAGQKAIELANDADPRSLALDGIECIDLKFPKFTDGRAYSQAFLLRRRLGFKGELRATGDVLVDQLQLMQRSGFDSAVLRPDQDMAAAQRQLAYFHTFYQGDAISPQPHFSVPASLAAAGPDTPAALSQPYATTTATVTGAAA